MGKDEVNDTRTLVLATAKPMFAKRGFSGVSVREIAQLCGIRAASLYHHFPDKQSLYLAMDRKFNATFQPIFG